MNSQQHLCPNNSPSASLKRYIKIMKAAVTLSYLALVLGGTFALDQYLEDADRFPGWRGELPGSLHVAYQDSVGYGELGKEVWRGKVEQLSWEPRAFLYHNFLSDEECDHLIKLAEGHLQKSTVVDANTGGSVDSQVRTSSGTFLHSRQDDIVTRIEKRLAHVSMIPEENGESLQILKYVNGQKYEPHSDYFHDSVNSDPSHGGQRVATVLMYLTTPEEGGETVFPYAESNGDSKGNWSDCAKRGLAVKAKKGNALLFYSLKPDGSEDVKSTHGSCPTLKGTKYSATKWLHVGVFNKDIVKQTCEDDYTKCEQWAVMGECENNPVFMSEHCKLSCKKCPPQSSGSQKGLSRKEVM